MLSKRNCMYTPITDNIHKAKETLLKNELVSIPTETVYGLAGNACSEIAIHKIYNLKQRPLHNPLIVHIKSSDVLSSIVEDIPNSAKLLADTFWPGPLTLVLKKNNKISDLVTSGKDTVAIRVPGHPMTLELLNLLDFPLVAPSANPSGSISPTSAEHVANYFGDKLEVILDGGQCIRGIESTIIGFDNKRPVLFRHGAISVEDIENVIGSVSHKMYEEKSPDAPGMLSRHYAPSTKTIMTDKLHDSINRFAGKRIGLLVFKDVPVHTDIYHLEVLSLKGDLYEAASNLYAALHRLDRLNLDIIIAEKLPDIYIGNTINDRLKRATTSS
jgi:L-threonylcarbamoyladenylate synthase